EPYFLVGFDSAAGGQETRRVVGSGLCEPVGWCDRLGESLVSATSTTAAAVVVFDRRQLGIGNVGQDLAIHDVSLVSRASVVHRVRFHDIDVRTLRQQAR